MRPQRQRKTRAAQSRNCGRPLCDTCWSRRLRVRITVPPGPLDRPRLRSGERCAELPLQTHLSVTDAFPLGLSAHRCAMFRGAFRGRGDSPLFLTIICYIKNISFLESISYNPRSPYQSISSYDTLFAAAVPLVACYNLAVHPKDSETTH